MLDQITGLERQLIATETERKQILVRRSFLAKIISNILFLFNRKKLVYQNQMNHVYLMKNVN